MTLEQVKALLARKEQELAEAKKPAALRLKVSEKTQALSLYGINSRFPVTLYAGQWERLITFVPEITKFIAAHKSELAWKDE
jgi:hypothetical protein